jgi:hypothetical protein
MDIGKPVVRDDRRPPQLADNLRTVQLLLGHIRIDPRAAGSNELNLDFKWRIGLSSMGRPVARLHQRGAATLGRPIG